MESFIKRVCEWNAARYEQENNRALTYRLLEEELFELKLAQTDVDDLDALIDLIYIAIGGMWKMGLNADEINAALHIVADSNDTKPAIKTASHIKANVDKGKYFIAPEPQLQQLLDNLAKDK